MFGETEKLKAGRLRPQARGERRRDERRDLGRLDLLPRAPPGRSRAPRRATSRPSACSTSCLREPQVASEKEVVANERRYRVDDDVEGLANELLYKTAFTTHPYHWPTIGWMEDIKASRPTTAPRSIGRTTRRTTRRSSSWATCASAACCSDPRRLRRDPEPDGPRGGRDPRAAAGRRAAPRAPQADGEREAPHRVQGARPRRRRPRDDERAQRGALRRPRVAPVSHARRRERARDRRARVGLDVPRSGPLRVLGRRRAARTRLSRSCPCSIEAFARVRAEVVERRGARARQGAARARLAPAARDGRRQGGADRLLRDWSSASLRTRSGASRLTGA